MGVGLGNNGGSLTIIKSANTLFDLGEDVVIVDSGPLKYTWGPIKVPHIKINDINKIDGDIIIGTGVGSISHTNDSKIKNKYFWVRGWETWNVSELKLINMLKESKTKKIVNSICLQKKLKTYGIESVIISPGHDFDEIFPLDIRKNNKKIILGGLYNEGKKRLKKRTSWILDCYSILKSKYNIELHMFGSDGTPSSLFLDKFFKNPDIKLKNKVYNKIDIWLSPSELEGLHVAPAEAMLTECCVSGNNAELSGTKDYLIDHETGLVSENNFKSFLANVEILINHKTLRTELGKKGREKILFLGDRKKNMKKFIKLMKDDLNP
jgi:glycosyltransferase involved in cell wall biosynthesis